MVTGRELLGERYELRDVLGCGGMAEVRDGWDTRLARPVAVKLLHPGLRSQPDVVARFEDEARSAARLTHPNVVAVHDFGEQDGTPFIVMERLPGRTLADVMAAGPMPPAAVRDMVDDVLAALEVAHAAGVLHRDIKPSNILLSSSGDSLKVADFGIAKTGGAAHTLTGQLVGTIAYMSSERIAGAPASVADDLYAVGVMAYEALLGHPAFPHDNPITLARAILDDPPPPLSTGAGVADTRLAAVVDRAMAHDGAQRFGSAAQMRAALRDWRAASAPMTGTVTEVLPAPTVALAARPHPPRRRRIRPALAAAGVLVAFAVAVVSLAMGPFSTSAPPEPVSTSTTVPPPPSALPAPASVPIPVDPPVSAAPVVEQQVQPAPPPVPAAGPRAEPPTPPAAGNGPKGPGNNGNGHGNGKGPGNGPKKSNGNGRG